jgi:protein-S-isoprenylcysteine O-methyltransferase Ste14
MAQQQPQDPTPMSPATAIAYAVALPISLLLLVFLPAGDIGWVPGWIFVAALLIGFAASGLVLARINPVIFRARSRFQPGTERWDLPLVAVILTAMVATIPVASFDAGRAHWSHVPLWLVVIGYAALLGGIAVTAWAQAVNPFFEPGVRIQSERHQRVIDSGPYGFVRHPGYSAAVAMFLGISLALASWWGLVPAAIASILLAVRTAWEDRLLHDKLPGYRDYAARVQARLVPGIW